MSQLMKLECATCGGRLNKVDDTTYVCVCCKSKYEPTDAKNDAQTTELFLASQARQKGNFIDSLKQYEDIFIASKTDDFDSYWGAMLADMKIVYSTRDGVALPIFYEASEQSIFDNKYYKKAMACCHYGEDYKAAAAKIDSLRYKAVQLAAKSDIDIAIICLERYGNNEMTAESKLAEKIVTKLRADGRKVFFSLTDLATQPYDEYDPYIYAALRSSKVAIILTSGEDNLNADYVRYAWKRYIRYPDKLPIVCMLDCAESTLPIELRSVANRIHIEDGSLVALYSKIKQIFAPIPKETPDAPVAAAVKPKGIVSQRVSTSGAKTREKMADDSAVSYSHDVSGGSQGQYGSIHTNPAALRELSGNIRAYNNCQQEILQQTLSSLSNLSGQWNDSHLEEILISMRTLIAQYGNKSGEANQFAEWLSQKAIALESKKTINH